MKNFILITILFTTVTLSANELAWVDEQIEAIKPARVGLKSSSVSSMRDPFIFLKKYKKKASESKVKSSNTLNRISSASSKTTDIESVRPKKSKTLSLKAVMNKSALINGKWHKKGDIVNGYKLVEVNKESVLLIKKSKKLILSTQSINKNLNFKNK